MIFEHSLCLLVNAHKALKMAGNVQMAGKMVLIYGANTKKASCAVLARNMYKFAHSQHVSDAFECGYRNGKQ